MRWTYLLALVLPAAAHAQFTYSPPPCAGGSFSCGFRDVSPATEACTDDRWVGFRLTPGACFSPGFSTRGTWGVRNLFPAGPNTPAVFSQFCVYEWTPRRAGSSPDLNALPNLAGMRLERDCKGAGPLYVPSSVAAGSLQKPYHDQVRRPLFDATALIPPKVRVAVIDSAPDETTSGLPSGAAAGHARAVASLIRELSCKLRDNGLIVGCAAFITTYRGLTLGIASDGDGTFGYPSEVGTAMLRAITDFNAQGAQNKLIINLSVGWDSRYGALHGPDIKITALAPWLVAQWAAYQDILVIAAAGNGGDATVTGPMYPGGWEAEPTKLYPIFESYSPVVYAVGGVDGRDQPLTIGRPGGSPRFVAPAQWVSAPRRAGQSGPIVGTTEVLTGTSMAAAAMSGVAAMAWSQAFALSNDALMYAMFLASTPLGAYMPEFESPPGLGQPRHRLDACQVMSFLGAQGLLPCTNATPFVDHGASTRTFMDLQFPGLRTSPPTPGFAIAPAQAKPAAIDSSATPYVSPQPGSMSCPTCVLDGNTLYGKYELDPAHVVTEIYLLVENCDAPSCNDQGGIKLIFGNLNEPFAMEVPVDAASAGAAKLEMFFHEVGSTTLMSTLSAVELGD